MLHRPFIFLYLHPRLLHCPQGPTDSTVLVRESCDQSISTLDAVPAAAERKDKRNVAAVVKQRPTVEARPRSPNPTAMPESLTKAPPLKPTLDPSAKSWIEIAVSQRGPSRNGRAGPRPGQDQVQGPQSHDQAFPGTASLGVLMSCPV